ncbi:hypothetical protein F4775DRAFT_603410 [Biscogniauxia sp. FL1348]|nr:hypothetical protein F4775DRAFT_603410 [Biscogniauxia sp. FL1348]
MAKVQSPGSRIWDLSSHPVDHIVSSDQTTQFPSNDNGENVQRLGPHDQHLFSTASAAFTSGENKHFLTSKLESDKIINIPIMYNQQQNKDNLGLSSMDSKAFQHSESPNPTPRRPGRFIEDLDSVEMVVPPIWFMDHENRSSYTLVNSHNSSIAAAGATTPTEKPSVPRRSERLAKKQQQQQAQEQAQQKKRQHLPSPLQFTSRGGSTVQQHATPSRISSPIPTPATASSSSSSSRTLPSPRSPSSPLSTPARQQPPSSSSSPYFRLRDSQGRPTAYAVDRSPGRYPLTDPRSVNNLYQYTWLNPPRRSKAKSKNKRKNKNNNVDEADLQRRGSPRYPVVVPGVHAELVPVRESSSKGAKKQKNGKEKQSMMWVARPDPPHADGSGWKDVHWGAASPPTPPLPPPTTPPPPARKEKSSSSSLKRKTLPRRIRSWVARRRGSPSRRIRRSSSSSSALEEDEPQRQTPSSRTSVVPSPEELEADEEAREVGPSGERKYADGEYAAVVALGGDCGYGCGCGGGGAAAGMMSPAPDCVGGCGGAAAGAGVLR